MPGLKSPAAERASVNIDPQDLPADLSVKAVIVVREKSLTSSTRDRLRTEPAEQELNR